MKLLVVYGSTEGQTRKISEFLQEEAQKAGHHVKLHDSTQNPPQPNNFDAVIIGSSIHYGKYQSSVDHYIQEHQEELNSIPGAFISVSMAIASTEPESKKELNETTEHFLDKTGWKPIIVEQVGGALRYSKYNFFKKLVMRMIARKEGSSTDISEDHEYTDWDQVKRIIKKLENKVPVKVTN